VNRLTQSLSSGSNIVMAELAHSLKILRESIDPILIIWVKHCDG